MAGPWEKYAAEAPAAPKPWERYAQAPAPAAPAPTEQPSRFSQAASAVGRGAAIAGQGLARGVTMLAGAPVDLVNASPMLGNLLPGEQGFKPISENPIGGSQSLWSAVTAPRDAVQAATGVPVGDMEPEGSVERIIERLSEEVGAAAVPVAGVMGAAARTGVQGARQMQTSARPITRTAGRMVESAAVNPAAFARKEAYYASGAGLGAGGARELASDGDESTTTRAEAVAELVGALGGVGAAAGGHYASQGAKDVFAALFNPEKFATQAARSEAASALGTAGGAQAAPSGALDTSALSDQIASGPRISDTVPGWQDLTADVSRNPGIASLEYSRQAGDGAGLFNTRRSDNQNAANEAMNEAKPDATPGQFSAPARQRRDDIAKEADDVFTRMEDELDTTAGRLRPAMPSEARGQTIRGSLEDALDGARQTEREAWSQVRGEVDPAPLAAAFDEVYGGLTQSERRIVDSARGAIDTPNGLVPEQGPDEIVSAVLGPDGQPFRRPAPEVSEMTDLSEVTSLRSEFTSAARVAEAAGDSNKARILSRFVDKIDGFLDGAPEIAGPLADARNVSRDLNDRFTRRPGAIGDTLATTGSGGRAVPDAAVAPRFVQPDTGETVSLDKLLRETKDDEAVRASIADQILADVERQGLVAKPDALERYLGQYSRAFEKFPALKAEYGNAAALKRKVDAAEQGVKDVQRTLFDPGSGNAVAKYLQYGDERAKDAMKTVVNAKDPTAAADELLSFVGDAPQAVQGARAAFWDVLEEKAKSTGVSTRTGGGEQAWRFQSLKNFLDDPKTSAVIERLYKDDPQHLAHLREMADTLAGANFGTTGKAANASGTGQALGGSGRLGSVLPSAESLSSRGFAVKRGQVSPQFAAFNILSVMARKLNRSTYADQIGRVLDEALLDPDAAATLLRDFNPANVAALARTAKGWGIAQLPTLIDALEGELPGEDNDMMEAVGR